MNPTLTKVLAVDDEPAILSVLKDQLVSDGFALTLADSPSKALEVLKRERFSVVIADQEMPGMTGIDLLSQLQPFSGGAARLLLTSNLKMTELLDFVQSNRADGYLTKPWLREDLLAIVRNSVARKLSESALPFQEAKEARLKAAPDALAKSEQVAASIGSGVGIDSAEAVVGSFLKMLSSFHPNLGSTAVRTMALCKTLGQVLDLPSAQTNSLIWAAALHDISLVALERSLVRRWLRSPESCAPEEMTLIRKHPNESEEMLRNHPIFKETGEIIRSHHENWDGSGYPDRLKGEMIPRLARVLAVAIYFSSRHQPAIQVMNEIEGLADKIFDTQAVEAMAKAVPLTNLPRGEREILIRELQAGMVLARDIHNASGVLVIAKGKELTAPWIGKIQYMNNISPLNPYVLVYC